MNFEAPGNNLERFVQINEFQRKHRGEIIDRLVSVLNISNLINILFIFITR